MNEMSKHVKNRFSLYSVILALVGLVLLIFPGTTMQIVSYCFGGGLMLCGAFMAIRYFADKSVDFVYRSDLATGLIMLVIGLFVILKWKTISSVIPFVLALMIVCDGVIELENAVSMKRMNVGNWAGVLVTSLITVAVGIVVLCNPFDSAQVLLRFIGACLLCDAVARAVVLYRMEKLKKAVTATARELDEEDE